MPITTPPTPPPTTQAKTLEANPDGGGLPPSPRPHGGRSRELGSSIASRTLKHGLGAINPSPTGFLQQPGGGIQTSVAPTYLQAQEAVGSLTVGLHTSIESSRSPPIGFSD